MPPVTMKVRRNGKKRIINKSDFNPDVDVEGWEDHGDVVMGEAHTDTKSYPDPGGDDAGGDPAADVAEAAIDEANKNPVSDVGAGADNGFGSGTSDVGGDGGTD